MGREAAAATDAELLAEIFTWSRSRGLFAGVSLDGSVLQIDHTANAAFYNGANVTDPNQPIPVPASAIALMRQVGYYTGTPGESLSATPLAPAPTRAPAPTPRRVAVADARARRGSPIFRPCGSNSLRPRCGCTRYSTPTGGTIWPCRPKSMPATVRPMWQSLQQTLGRFEAVARDPQYALLAQRVGVPRHARMVDALRRRFHGHGPQHAPACPAAPPKSPLQGMEVYINPVIVVKPIGSRLANASPYSPDRPSQCGA